MACLWNEVFVFLQEYKNANENELRDFVCDTDTSLSTLIKHALVTYELYKRGGPDWMIKDNYRVRNHLEHLLKEAVTLQHWWD